MVRKKRSNNSILFSRRLAARLAGAAFLGISPIAQALQNINSDSAMIGGAIRPDGRNDTLLQLSSNLLESRGASEPVWQVPIDPLLVLRVARGLTVPMAVEVGVKSNRLEGGSAPLKLSQSIQARKSRQQRTLSNNSLLDVPLSLRSSGGLNMPGAAGVGRPRQDVADILPSIDAGVSDFSAAGGDGAPVSGEVFSIDGPSSAGESGEGGVSWVIPPIRWGGSLGYSLQRSSASGGMKSSGQAVSGSLNASSFIYAPWFATVSGRLGVTRSSSDSGTADPGGQGSQSVNSSLNGGGDLNVFPSSRFPFQAYIDRSDSRASGSLVDNDYVNTRFGLRQNYRAEDGITTASGQFDHSAVDSTTGAGDVVTALSGSYATNLGVVRNSVSGRYSLGQREGTGERARLLGVNTSHNANFDDNISLSGNVNFLDNAITAGTGLGATGDSQTRFLLLSAFGTWMPWLEEFGDETIEYPLSLSGSMQYSMLNNEFSGQGLQSENLGGNVNANYRFSNNLTAGVSGGVNQVTTAGSPAIRMASLGSNVNYSGDLIKLGDFSYNWNTGGNANYQSGSGVVAANYMLGFQAGHSLSRFFVLSGQDTLSFSFSQSLGANQNQTIGSSGSLSNSLSMSYGGGWGEGFAGSSTLSVSDVSTTGVGAQRYRTLGLGLNGQGQLSQLSSANVNLQFNWSEQSVNDNNTQAASQSTAQSGSQSELEKKPQMSLLGTASYSHSRFFRVRGLRYTMLFTADTRTKDQRLLGDTNGSYEPVRWNFTNRFDYRIGLLDFRVNAALNDVGGKKNALLFLQVTRQIGAY